MDERGLNERDEAYLEEVRNEEREEARQAARERMRARTGASEPKSLSPEPMRTTRTGEPKETKHRAQRVKEKA